MKYELWDIASGTGLATFENESEMRALIESLLNHHGADQIDAITLVIDDESEPDQAVTGDELRSWLLGESTRDTDFVYPMSQEANLQRAVREGRRDDQ